MSLAPTGRPGPDFLPSLTAGLAWGGMFPIAAGALHHVGPFHLTAVRYALATLVFAGLLVAAEGAKALRTDGRGWELFGLGTLGFAGFNLLTFVGLDYTKPQDASLIVAMQPLFTALAIWALMRRRPSRSILVAIAVALLGVALVITKGDPAAAVRGGGLGGDGLITIGCVAWIAYTLGASRFPGVSPLRYTTLTAAGGTLSILIVTEAATMAGIAHPPTARDLGDIALPLAYIVLIAAVLGVIAWNTGVRRLGAPNATLYMNLVPVVAFTIAIAGGYRPGVVELAGALLTLGALVGANLAARQESVRPSSPACAATRAANPAKSRA